MNKPRYEAHPPEFEDEPDAEELMKVWSLLDRVAPPAVSPVQTDAEWASLSRRMGRTVTGVTERPRLRSTERTSGLHAALRAAAMIAVLVGGAAAWYAVPVTRTAGPGQQLAVALPDGSEALLNAGSEVRFRRAFAFLPGLQAGTRSVRLDGEAFFDVRPAERPFAVEAGAAQVRVLGTRFNVRARGGLDADVRVDVEEGRVEVRARRAEAAEAVVLEAGQAARVDPASAEVARASVRTDRMAAWRTGGLTAVDEPLGDILAELSLRYGTSIALADTAAGSTRLSVYYPSLGAVESVLADLVTQQGLGFRRTADGWEVF